MNNVITLLISCALISNCVSQKQTNPIEFIKFGTAGGFTGEANGYQISLSDGTIQALKDAQKSKTLTENELEILIPKIRSVMEIKFDEPANMYKFIEITNNKQEVLTFQWGVSNNAPKKLEQLFNFLSSVAPQ